MSGQQTFLKDKPYEFVPLLRECRKEKYFGHHVIEEDTYAGKLKLKLTTLSPLHIGGGDRDYDENGNVIVKQMCRNGKAVIPGSSLKGAVRSIAEAVSYSISGVRQLKQCHTPYWRGRCQRKMQFPVQVKAMNFVLPAQCLEW